MSFLSSIAFKLISGLAVVGLIVALWMRGNHYAEEATAAKALLKSAIAIGNANAEVAKSQAETVKRIDAVATVAAINKANIRAKSDARRKEIIHEPAFKDAPLAPVLRDQLDRLPEPPGSNEDRNSRTPTDPRSALIADAGPNAAAGHGYSARRGPRDRGFHRSARVMQRGQGRYPVHLGGVRTWKPSTA